MSWKTVTYAIPVKDQGLSKDSTGTKNRSFSQNITNNNDFQKIDRRRKDNTTMEEFLHNLKIRENCLKNVQYVIVLSGKYDVGYEMFSKFVNSRKDDDWQGMFPFGGSAPKTFFFSLEEDLFNDEEKVCM